MFSLWKMWTPQSVDIEEKLLKLIGEDQKIA